MTQQEMISQLKAEITKVVHQAPSREEIIDDMLLFVVSKFTESEFAHGYSREFWKMVERIIKKDRK